MNKILKITVAVFTLVAFFFTAAICCCVVRNLVSAHKVSCLHCASKGQANPTGQECCFGKAIPMELAKIFSLPALLPILVLVFVHFFYVRPMSRLTLRNIYVNGPPGLVRTVPLYIQSRSIRI